MQADIGRGAVRAVILGDRDVKRRLVGHPDGPAEAEEDHRVGEHVHIRGTVGRGMHVHLHRQIQAGQGAPRDAGAPEPDERAAYARQALWRVGGQERSARSPMAARRESEINDGYQIAGDMSAPAPSSATRGTSSTRAGRPRFPPTTTWKSRPAPRTRRRSRSGS